MSLKRVLKVLESFGLTRVESEVYIYLSKTGPSRANTLCVGLGLTRQQLCPALEGLREKGIVASRPEHVRLFSVIAFEELLNRFTKLNATKAEAIRRAKEELVKSWQDLVQQNNS